MLVLTYFFMTISPTVKIEPPMNSMMMGNRCIKLLLIYTKNELVSLDDQVD